MIVEYLFRGRLIRLRSEKTSLTEDEREQEKNDGRFTFRRMAAIELVLGKKEDVYKSLRMMVPSYHDR